MSSLTALQLECQSQQGGAAAEGVVVGVGVDAVEEGGKATAMANGAVPSQRSIA